MMTWGQMGKSPSPSMVVVVGLESMSLLVNCFCGSHWTSKRPLSTVSLPLHVMEARPHHSVTLSLSQSLSLMQTISHLCFSKTSTLPFSLKIRQLGRQLYKHRPQTLILVTMEW